MSHPINRRMPERRKDTLIKHHSVFPPIHPQSLRLDNSIRNSLFHRRHIFLKFRMENISQRPISQSDILLFHRKHLLGIPQILHTNPIQGIKKLIQIFTLYGDTLRTVAWFSTVHFPKAKIE